ncbi:MAG: hypothetical protein WD801_09235 [Gemmatimonadaceae bacterium]
MKTFRDSENCEWTVFEVRRQVGVHGDTSYLPSGFNEGWLCFEAESAKRRLVRYPERWRELADEDLERLLAEAQPAPKPSSRLDGDLLDDSSSTASE